MSGAPADYANELGLALRVTAPAVRAAIADFTGAGPRGLGAGARGPSHGLRGLDAGCGQGQHAVWLAEAAGPEARVTGLDPSQPHLDAAAALAAATPQAPQLDFVRGELESLPFADASFDWLWCADTLWPGITTDDPVRTLRALSRVLRSGGRLGLLYWSGQSLLCGHPQLEARLSAAMAATIPYLAVQSPDLHFLRAPGWLAAAGFTDVRARTYVADLQGPLPESRREGLAYCLRMLWGRLEAQVSPDDWSAFVRLSQPGSADCLLERPDYYGFVTYTLVSGVLEGGAGRAEGTS